MEPILFTSRLNIVSFNCKNIKTSIDEIRELCEGNDIVLLQETWLFKMDIPILNQINKDFYARGISSMMCEDSLLTGRPNGGLAILWRKSLGSSCSPIIYENEKRIMSLQLNLLDTKYLFVNVYLPFCCPDNHEEFIGYLSKIDSIILDAETPYVFVLGDFNADVCNGQSFGKELSLFCHEEDLIISDIRHLSSADNYTYMSEAHQTTSWLDHIICTYSAHAKVSSVRILYSMVSSDHFPIVLELALSCNIKCNPSAAYINSEKSVKRVKWDDLSKGEICAYRQSTERLLSSFPLDVELFLCDDPQCSNPSHFGAIDLFYNNIIDALWCSGESLSENCKTKFHQIPGWNDCCREVHAQAREAFLMWRRHGSPKHGIIFRNMCTTRAQFKSALRKCKRDSERAVADSLAKKMLSKDTKSFWKQIQHVNNEHITLEADCVGGVSGPENICNMWFDYYSGLLNSCKEFSMRDTVLNQLSNVSFIEEFTLQDVIGAIKLLKKGK